MRRPSGVFASLVLVLVLAQLLATACTGGASGTTTGAQPAGGAPASATPAAPAAQDGQVLQLGNVRYANRGTKDVKGMSTLELEADDFYFGPTFLQGTPGQRLTLQIKNEGKAPHTFTIAEQQIDQTIQPGGSAELTVSMPASGALRFYCRFHAAQGMNGELLAGDATPQPASSTSSEPAQRNDPSGYGY